MAVSRQTLLSLLLLGSATLALASTSPRDGAHSRRVLRSLLARTPTEGESEEGEEEEGGEVGEGAGAVEMEAPDSAEAMGDAVLLAHAVLGCLAFALVFPVGGIIIRALRSRFTLWLHAGWQMVGWAMAVVTLGTGIWLANSDGYLSPGNLKYHVVVGLVATLGVTLQPVTGWMHHVLFKRVGGRTAWSYAHIVWGVGIVTLGAINGAFGLVLEHRETKYIIVYGVLAAVVWAIWMGISAMAQLARRRTKQAKAVETSSYRDGSGSHDDSMRERGLGGQPGEKANASTAHHSA